MNEYVRSKPENGRLFISGGRLEGTIGKFVEMVGDPDAPVIIIPTAGEADRYDQNYRRVNFLREAGLKNLTVLHTRDREEANSEEFVRPIREAKAVFIDGGRQWRLADAYLHTLVHTEFNALLDRGGIIGGTSAGASIQASFMVRGDTSNNFIMMGDHQEGFGFLENTAIDQHHLKRNRHFDLIEVIEAHPELLGIGIDESAAIIVSNDIFEVVGSYVAIYDKDHMIPPKGKFYFLAPGDRFNLKTRKTFQIYNGTIIKESKPPLPEAANTTQNGGPWMKYVHPEQAGWSLRKLETAKKVFEEIGSAAFMVIDRGAVVVSWGNYAFPYLCHSIRKSILSALFGFHVQEGTIDLEKTLVELNIEDNPPLTPAEKEAKIIHLLKARSGVYHEAASETEAMKKLRPHRGSHPPDTHWYYNNWDFNALEKIFEQETGQTVFDEFATRLARPLHMEDYNPELMKCYYDEQYSVHGAHHYRLSARDLARFGMLYLQKGKWGKQQLLPASWIEESTAPYSFTNDNRTGYGYLWWISTAGLGKDLGIFEASGYGGHRVAIIPGADLVLVHRADTDNNRHVPPANIMKLFRMILDVKRDAASPEKRPDPELAPL
jgi:cyanophycinase